MSRCKKVRHTQLIRSIPLIHVVFLHCILLDTVVRTVTVDYSVLYIQWLATFLRYSKSKRKVESVRLSHLT